MEFMIISRILLPNIKAFGGNFTLLNQQKKLYSGSLPATKFVIAFWSNYRFSRSIYSTEVCTGIEQLLLHPDTLIANTGYWRMGVESILKFLVAPEGCHEASKKRRDVIQAKIDCEDLLAFVRTIGKNQFNFN